MGCQMGLGSIIGRLQVFDAATVFDLTCATEGATGGKFGRDPDELLGQDLANTKFWAGHLSSNRIWVVSALGVLWG